MLSRFTIAALLASFSLMQASFNPWEEFEEVFDEMYRQQKAHCARMKTFFQTMEELPGQKQQQKGKQIQGVQVELKATSSGVDIVVPVSEAASSNVMIKYNEQGDEQVRVTVPLDNGTLQIMIGNRLMSVEQHFEEKSGSKEQEYWSSARSAYARTLPIRIDTSTVQAEYKDGALHITFAEKQDGKLIQVKGLSAGTKPEKVAETDDLK